jgi:hypothetical protein
MATTNSAIHVTSHLARLVIDAAGRRRQWQLMLLLL